MRLLILILLSFSLSAQQSVTIPTVTTNSGTGYVEVLAGAPQVLTDPNYSYILDSYTGSALAVSTRKLRSAYAGSCLRVRRSSDNAEQDIGFVSNYLDITSMATFVGANNGFVVKWYDQSGNANDLIQATAANQPKIINAGTLLTQNGKACMTFDGSNDNFDLTTGITTVVSWSGFMVSRRRTTGVAGPMLSNTNAVAPICLMHHTDSKVYLSKNPTAYVSTSADATAALNILSGVYNGTAAYAWKNNSSIPLSSFGSATTGNFLKFGARSTGPTTYADADALEFIFYSTDQSANISGVNANINAYYAIY